ncbi:MAG: SGNH/GDSL hydrolase family protein [Acidobacteriaceae bacterium]|nr:SGNH/GDSL hydrolase family protein [Acidobacteriaceae bacterium]
MLRVRVSNAVSSVQLQLDAATIGLRVAGSNDVVAGSLQKLTFNGRNSVTIPSGATFWSDPVPLKFDAFNDLVINLHIPDFVGGIETGHIRALTTNLILSGDQTKTQSIPADVKSTNTTAWFFLQGVDVAADMHASSVITVGDSITDGTKSTTDANHRYPDFLAQRFAAAHGVSTTASFSVLNAGISGNRILHDGAGPDTFARLERDVLTQPGARYVILLEGVNDIATSNKPGNEMSPADLIGAYQQLTDRIHAAGMKLIVGTIMPFGLSGSFTDSGEQKRLAINQWIRTTKTLDGVLDFDAALRNPEHPIRLKDEFDSGDHIHPSDAGYAEMASVLDIARFVGVYQPSESLQKKDKK